MKTNAFNGYKVEIKRKSKKFNWYTYSTFASFGFTSQTLKLNSKTVVLHETLLSQLFLRASIYLNTITLRPLFD
jgi:hypothetical protein